MGLNNIYKTLANLPVLATYYGKVHSLINADEQTICHCCHLINENNINTNHKKFLKSTGKSGKFLYIRKRKIKSLGHNSPYTNWWLRYEVAQSCRYNA